MSKYIRYTVKGYDKELVSGPYKEEDFEYHLNDIRTYESVTILEVYDGPEQAQSTSRDRVRRKR